MEKVDVKKLAQDHWDYVCSVSEKMYIDAFIHGYKHGKEELKSSPKE